ncbi:MAG: putative lipid II flippase FtsW [Clostridiales bacterium]|nr:putative lipid II flippase FtsW [Clostridiales bacterium]
MDGRDYYNRQNPRARSASSSGHRKAKASHDSVAEKFRGWLKPVKGAPDYIFLAVVLLLVAYGIIMLFSASSAKAYATYNNAFFFVKRQAGWIVVGGFAMLITSKIDYHRYGGKINGTVSVAGAFYVITGILLLLVISGLGTTVNGATRWLFGFQPSELAKIAIIILFAYSLSRDLGQKNLKHFGTGLFSYMLIFGVYVALLALEPHFSCVILIFLTIVIMLFVAGVPLKHFGMCAIPVALGVIGLVIIEPYRMARVTSFLNPFADKQGDGWQIVQSLYAIGSGGIFGVGLGQSRQKYQSLPEPHNDFIFSVLCEELGLIGAILLVALFMVLLIRGIKIAMKAPDLFGMLLVVGIVGIVCLQAAINIAVVTASIPVTGMPLPFFSYGGTALAITMAEMGIVLNVSRQAKLPI